MKKRDAVKDMYAYVKAVRKQVREQGVTPLPTDIPLNCPYCGAKLVNVPSDTSVAFYECPKDGLLVLPPDGRLRKAIA